jgi:ectoine hydroxylase-related dioxygenase (phytanoyl-CoA dioxygenase family)
MSFNEEFIVSAANEDASVLRARFQQYGYLYFKRYVSADKCAALLDTFVDLLSPHIGYQPDSKQPILQGKPFFETDEVWDEVYPKMQSVEDFHGFFHEDDIRSLMEKVSGSDVFIYPMKMARISTPRKMGYETPPHQDAHSHHAGPTMAGVWVALQDIDEEMGRLKFLPGSHKRGLRSVFEADGVGGVQCEIFPDEDIWHVSDVEQGDLIIFNSATVHKAEPNTAENKARLSVDTRFCDYGAPVFISNIEPHHGWRIEGFDWESIYRDWSDESLQYYWKDYPGLFSTFGEKRFFESLE